MNLVRMIRRALTTSPLIRALPLETLVLSQIIPLTMVLPGVTLGRYAPIHSPYFLDTRHSNAGSFHIGFLVPSQWYRVYRRQSPSARFCRFSSYRAAPHQRGTAFNSERFKVAFTFPAERRPVQEVCRFCRRERISRNSHWTHSTSHTVRNSLY